MNPKLSVVIAACVVLAVMALMVPVAAENIVNQSNASEPYYITIDPIGNHTVNDVFFINGTTNLPSGTNFSIDIFKYGSDPLISVSYFSSTIPVQSGKNGTNFWSCNITPTFWTTFSKNHGPTQDIKYFIPDDFLAFVGTSNVTAHSEVFSVSLAQKNASEPYYITIDPIGNVTSGDVFIIHGTTNVPPTEILTGDITTTIFYHATKNSPNIEYPICFLPNISLQSTSSGTSQWSVNVTSCWSDLPIDWNPYTVEIHRAEISADRGGYVYTHQIFTILPPSNVTHTSIPVTPSFTRTPVQTSSTPSSTTTQSSPVPLALPGAALALFVVIRSLSGKKGD
ncbi:MAG: hypothetical protein LUQ31_00570 [Methanoregula sp.]|nr:hypothetical protein [Methanoregula sp.]